MDDFGEGGNTKMETCEKKRNDNLISMIWQLDFFMVSGYFWHWYFLVGGFKDNVGCRVGEHHYLAVAVFSCIGLICHAVITLRRNDKW